MFTIPPWGAMWGSNAVNVSGALKTKSHVIDVFDSSAVRCSSNTIPPVQRSLRTSPTNTASMGRGVPRILWENVHTRCGNSNRPNSGTAKIGSNSNDTFKVSLVALTNALRKTTRMIHCPHHPKAMKMGSRMAIQISVSNCQNSKMTQSKTTGSTIN